MRKRGGEGVKKSQNFADVIYGWPLTLFVLLPGGHQPQRPRGGERRGVPGHLRLRVRPRVDLRVPRLPHLPVERQVRKSW